MKRLSRILILASGISLFTVASSHAQIVVSARMYRPRTVVVVRPVRPSPRHVWVAEEWAPSGATYVYHAGYWAEPPRLGGVWIAGRWHRHHGGYAWAPGYWR